MFSEFFQLPLQVRVQVSKRNIKSVLLTCLSLLKAHLEDGSNFIFMIFPLAIRKFLQDKKNIKA